MRKEILCVFMLAGLLLSMSACQSGQQISQTSSVFGASVNEINDATLPALTQEDTTTDWAAENTIFLKGTNAEISGGAALADSVITINRAGIWRLSGDYSGQIVVDTAESGAVVLILDGVSINSTTGPALYVRQADKTILTLIEGTENSFTDPASYTSLEAGSDEPNACIFSKDDLTINGDGKLVVNANYNNGITSKDTLKLVGGTISVAAVDDGIMGRDAILVSGGTITVDAQDDAMKTTHTDADKGILFVQGGILDLTAMGKGLHATNALLVSGGEITIQSEDDALHSNGAAEIRGGVLTLSTAQKAIHADLTLSVSGGEIECASCTEGLESEKIEISGGQLTIYATDDGLNAAKTSSQSDSSVASSTFDAPENEGLGGVPMADSTAVPMERGGMGGDMQNDPDCQIVISGGTIYIDAGGDGIDSNGSVEMTGGTMLIAGPSSGGDGALDYNGSFAISGGVLLASGSAEMALNVSVANGQCAALIYLNSTLQAGEAVGIATDNGEVLFAFAPEKQYQSLVVSSPALQTGETYHILTGGTLSGESWNGYYSDVSMDGAQTAQTVTFSETLATVGQAGGAMGGGFGGRGPGGGNAFR